ncbi:PulJ/GspJ family protein [Lacimicrobium alkaliphilum]|nr:prepilin-type N-terminal cleavage/methylation domain-containing protein [Lacimicrobium alkaliphilum]
MHKYYSGFSLVEAMVALVILALTFTAVWGWFGTAVTSTQRIQQAVSLPEVFSQFAVQLELEPLQQQRAGVFQIDTYEIEWQASVNRQSTNELLRRQPEWIVTLFDVQAQVISAGRPVTSFETKIVKQWRDPDYAEPPEFM